MPILVPPAVPSGRLSAHPQPTLSVEELIIRPWRASDAPGVVAAYDNPDIQKWHSRTMTSDEAVEWVASWPQKWAAETHASWAVTENDQLVGRVAFHDLDLLDGGGEVAYWVLPGARGRNIAGRALTAATDWMFEAGFHRMSLLHSTRNAPSCRVADKAHYEYEGTARSQELHVDGWHDMHVHARIAG
jgi:[ribosomal protein S5]-alanine N-acetyltransferase